MRGRKQSRDNGTGGRKRMASPPRTYVDKASILRDLKHANMLLIFDDIETVVDIAPICFQNFLEELLTHTLHLKVLLTASSNSTSKRVTSVTEHVFTLEPLKPVDAAKLLALRVGGDMLRADLSKLCESPLLKYLNGNSHAISLTASIFHIEPRTLAVSTHIGSYRANVFQTLTEYVIM